MASTYLTRTAGSTGNRKTWTFSAWIKRSRISNADATQMLFGTHTDASNRLDIGFHNANNFVVKEKLSGTTNIDMTTNELLRDPSAWYHLVVAVDTTQATASNRVKIYINGVQITSFGDETYPSQNYDTLANVSGRTYTVGQEGGNNYYFDGSMSHVHFVDGTAYAASTFGSTDSTTGEWNINTSPSITMGTNGFTILKDGNTITDQSSNSNNFSLGAGTLTKTEDCPSNVFPTINPLNYQLSGCTLANGNTSLTATGGNGWRTFHGTLAGSTGKFYWEQKVNSYSGSSHYIGITDIDKASNNNSNDFELGGVSSYCYRADGGKVTSVSGSTVLTAGVGASFGAGNIIGIAMDLVNNKLYFSKDGAWQNSGNPESGASGTGSFFNITAGKIYTPATATYNTSNQFFSYNFGNGYFGTTAVSSAGTNASGNGIFEFNVPTGYTALSTKGLNL